MDTKPGQKTADEDVMVNSVKTAEMVTVNVQKSCFGGVMFAVG